MPVRVVLVDDREMVIEGLVAMLASFTAGGTAIDAGLAAWAAETAEVRSSPGPGTTVAVTVPLDEVR